jgi:hypothetical protein
MAVDRADFLARNVMGAHRDRIVRRPGSKDHHDYVLWVHRSSPEERPLRRRQLGSIITAREEVRLHPFVLRLRGRSPGL